jgi:hypothetical protein
MGSRSRLNSSSFIVYFESEGNQNLPRVLEVVRRTLKKREELRSKKLVFFTAEGQGPALAYNRFREFRPTIIAVTFPPGFMLKIKNEDGTSLEKHVSISDDLRDFFNGVGIRVLTGRLPFDGISSAGAINGEMKLMRDVLSLFGGGFSLCVQAVLQSCDMGLVEIGEQVIAISGDCAVLITASTTTKFLSADSGLSINEIICKAKNLTLTRKAPKQEAKVVSGDLFEKKRAKLLPPV